jgi:hypothetical protein
MFSLSLPLRFIFALLLQNILQLNHTVRRLLNSYT